MSGSSRYVTAQMGTTALLIVTDNDACRQLWATGDLLSSSGANRPDLGAQEGHSGHVDDRRHADCHQQLGCHRADRPAHSKQTVHHRHTNHRRKGQDNVEICRQGVYRGQTGHGGQPEKPSRASRCDSGRPFALVDAGAPAARRPSFSTATQRVSTSFTRRFGSSPGAPPISEKNSVTWLLDMKSLARSEGLSGKCRDSWAPCSESWRSR